MKASQVVGSMGTFVDSVQDEGFPDAVALLNIVRAVANSGEGPIASSDVLRASTLEPFKFSEMCRLAEKAGWISLTSNDGREYITLTEEGKTAIGRP